MLEGLTSAHAHGMDADAKEASPASPPLSPSQVHIQRLVLALLCVTCLEVFLPGLMAILAYRDTRLAAEVRAFGRWEARLQRAWEGEHQAEGV